MAADEKAPGVRWRKGRPLWRASKAAVRAGYPVKSANLSSLASDPVALHARAHRLQAEMREWLAGRTGNDPVFDGTIASLLRVYQIDPESTYHKLKPSSRHPYEVYARLLTLEVGQRRIDKIDGRDLRRWFAAWSAPTKDGGKPKIAAARMAMTVLKAALSFGKTCRMIGCAELKAIFDEIEFPCPQPRTEAPTAAEIIRARAEAHKAGHPLAALAYAVQFEATVRQYDIIGEWLPLSDPRPSAMIDGKHKWIGPTWAMIDEGLILRITPTKTERAGTRVTIDLRSCPMVIEELAGISIEARSGPIIVNPKTGLPYRQEYFRNVWRAVATAAGIAAEVWNRDLRAGGITEARQAGAPTDDVAKTAGHSDKRTTARVYDRDRLEAARRVAAARLALRSKGGA